MQPLAALYPTVRLSPWRQVRKISTPGCGPPVPPDLYSTQEDHPSWFPLVPSDWGIWASPPETDQDSCPGWLPPVPLNLVSSQEGFSPGPLTPRFKHFPATRILPLPFVWFLCGTWHIAFLQKQCQWEEFINLQSKAHNLPNLTLCPTTNKASCQRQPGTARLREKPCLDLQKNYFLLFLRVFMF